MCVLSLEDGMTAASWYAWLAFRRRVSMSAIGSVIVMACVASLAAVPRALGLGDLARGLSAIVEGPRPLSTLASSGRASGRGHGVVSLPGTLPHARELPGVSHLPQADPAEAELAEYRVRTAAPLAAGVATDRELRLAGRLVDQSLLGHGVVSYRLSGWWSRRAGRRRGSRAGAAARGPRRRSWRWEPAGCPSPPAGRSGA